MSPEEVKRTVSAVEKPGSPQYLQNPGAMIIGMQFDAAYHFNDSRQLVSVHLEKAGQFNVGLLHLSGNETNLAAYEKLVSFFRNKYGTERSRSLKSKDTGFPGLSAKSEWAVDGGKFFINIIPVTAGSSTLSLGVLLTESAR